MESDVNVVHVNTQQQVLSQYLAEFHWQCEQTEPRGEPEEASVKVQQAWERRWVLSVECSLGQGGRPRICRRQHCWWGAESQRMSSLSLSAPFCWLP